MLPVARTASNRRQRRSEIATRYGERRVERVRAMDKAANIWTEELNDLLRAASGGFLFGIPLLYTVEVWWIGSSISPPWMLLALSITFVVVYLLNQSEGFRRSLEVRPREALMETIEALGIGLVCAFLALVLLQRITPTTPLAETLGKLIFEGIPFSLGVALANSALSGDRARRRRQFARQARGTLAIVADLDATLIGATIVAFSIAPTEEVALLAASISPPWLLVVMAASLGISYAIVFVAGFSGEDMRRQQQGALQQPLTETIVSYLLCLGASAVLLWFFQQLGWDNPWQEWLADVLVLGLPAAIGGAAGRIVI